MKQSIQEEILSVLDLIAACVAIMAGFKILAGFLFAKAIWDFICCLYYSAKEIKEETKK